MAVKKAESKAPRRKPDFTGTPGELVSLDGLSLSFGKNLRTSPYDPLLDELAKAPGKVLRFSDAKAQPSIVARAKRKHMRVSFAKDAEGKLYVRFDGSADEDIRKSRRENILATLKRAPLSGMSLASALRNAGDGAIDAQLVERICEQLLRDGLLLKREGGEWTLNARAAAAKA